MQLLINRTIAEIKNEEIIKGKFGTQHYLKAGKELIFFCELAAVDNNKFTPSSGSTHCVEF